MKKIAIKSLVILTILLFASLSFSQISEVKKLTPVKKDYTVFKPLPIDVYVDSIEVVAKDGSTLTAGKEAWIKCKMKRGDNPINKNFRVTKYLDGVALGSELGSQINLTSEWTTLSTPWVAKFGNHKFKCFADSQGDLVETNERNNVMEVEKFIPLTIIPPLLKPDLKIVSLDIAKEPSGPALRKLIAGTDVYIRCAWEKTGGPATINWRLQFIIDKVAQGIGSTASDEPDRDNGKISRPYKLVAGKHSIGCKLDASGIVDESNERNNMKYIKIDVLPSRLLTPQRIIK